MWFDHVHPLPPASLPLSAVSTSARVPQSPLQMGAGASSSAVGVMTNEQLTPRVLHASSAPGPFPQPVS